MRWSGVLLSLTVCAVDEENPATKNEAAVSNDTNLFISD